MFVDSSLVASLSDLHRCRGVNGACLLYADFIVANHLPISDKKAHLVSATVTEMCDGYQSVGRSITEFYFAYDQCQLVVFCEGLVRLFVLAETSGDPDELGRVARRFFTENRVVLGQLAASPLTQRIRVSQTKTVQPEAEVEEAVVDSRLESQPMSIAEPVAMAPDPWIDFRENLHQILSRVLGGGQSTRLIDRVAKEHGYARQSPSVENFDSIAQTLIDKVPNRSTRRSLQSLVGELSAKLDHQVDRRGRGGVWSGVRSS